MVVAADVVVFVLGDEGVLVHVVVVEALLIEVFAGAAKEDVEVKAVVDVVVRVSEGVLENVAVAETLLVEFLSI